MHELHGAEAMDYKGPSRFVVHARAREGNRSIELSAESPALMHRWIELIGRHMHAHNAATAGAAPPSPAAPAKSSSRRRGSILDMLSPRRGASSQKLGAAGTGSGDGGGGSGGARRGSTTPFSKLGNFRRKSSGVTVNVAITAPTSAPVPPPPRRTRSTAFPHRPQTG